MFAICCILSYVKEKRFFTPLVLFGVVWNIFPAISCFGLLGLNQPSYKTHFLIVLAWVFFLVGYFIPFKNKSATGSTKRRANYTILAFGNLLALLIMLPHFFESVKILNAYGWSYLRNIAGETYSSSTIVNIINDWFTEPFIIASSSYLAFSFFTKKRIPIVLFALIIVNVLVSCVIFAARALLIKIAFFIIFALLFLTGFKILRKLSKQRKIIVSVVIIGLVLIAIYITSLRMNESDMFGTFLDSAIPYYIGPFSLIDYYINDPSYSLIGINYTFGGSFFGFAYNILRAVFYVLFGAEYNGTDYILTLVTQNNSPIGGGHYINAASTALYPMLRDFGVAGVVFGFFIIGLVFNMLQKRKGRYANDDFYSMVYVFMCYILFKSSMSYEPLSPSFIFTIIFCWIICLHGNNNGKIQKLFAENV